MNKNAKSQAGLNLKNQKTKAFHSLGMLLYVESEALIWKCVRKIYGHVIFRDMKKWFRKKTTKKPKRNSE